MPSVLDNYQTALRDPVFYQLQKRLVNFVILFKKRLPSYNKDDLYFPGVKIENLMVDKMVTFFEDFLIDITNGVVLTEDEIKKGKSDMTILARKRRLNHQPFKLTLDVVSDKTMDCVVRIFMGPKYDHLRRLIDINSNRMNFVELDTFLYKLTSGKNTIERNSFDMHNIVRDRIMTRDLMKKLETLADFKDFHTKDIRNLNTGFPARLLLPKGRNGGMDVLLFAIVTPLRLIDNTDMNVVNQNRRDFTFDYRSTVLLDKMPLGFPLDRYIDVGTFFTPNMRFVDAKIFHQEQTCDMRIRFNRYVLRDYNLVDQTTTGTTFTVDSNINMDQTLINLRDDRVIDL